ncbi:nucleoside-diphosphate sugar epimerase/dehydratase [uncultured Roseobacter sp.]|nr:nucleoside-diphosphate sugar epimerase/dehydratase [uncultured Roseobacter sp.]
MLQLLVDGMLLLASFVGAMALRLDSFYFLALYEPWIAIGITLPITLFIFVRKGFYRAVVRYISSRAFAVVFWGIFASSIILFCVSQLLGLFVPRSVPGIYAMLAFLSIGGVRFILRELFFRQQRRGRTPLLIYGAGTAGRDLVGVLGRGRDYTAIGFIDETPALHGTDIVGLRVYDPEMLPELVEDHGIKLVLLAIPEASRARRREIIDLLASLAVQVQTIPDLEDIVSGRSQISEIREVAPEDLLGRDPVPAKLELMSANITDKIVMVTGAGGSIGSELCRQISQHRPRTVVLFDVSEVALYTLEMELRDGLEARQCDGQIVPLLGSVQNPRRVQAVIRRYGVQTIYHAAAYKHVPLVEQNIVEGLRNNVFGTLTLLEAAIAANVESFILVSTDKAVRPTNVMGASKRMAELICQAHSRTQTQTSISIVRFGNVLGSSGSVIPRFRKQIATGGPVTVTDPEITRYFMSIPEAAQLVIQAGAMAKGGDVFLLDMGAPVKIADLADRMIRLSGLTPYIEGQSNGDVEIVFTQLRPGEKLYEELLIGDDARPTDHPRIMTANERCISWEELQPIVKDLLAACLDQDVSALRELLADAPTGYRPDAQLVDLTAASGSASTNTKASSF